MVYRGKAGAFYKISSNEFKDRVINFALGLKKLGIKPESKVILLSENRPEWHIADFACHLLNAVVVPIFPTLIAEQIQYIVQNSDSEAIILSNKQQAGKIHQIKPELKKVKTIVTMEPEAALEEDLCFEKVIECGREQDDAGFFEKAVQSADADTVATIIYTSGTTGAPKGVMLTHKNIVANVMGCSKVIDITSSDRGLSFLPLSHAFERTVDYLYFYRGATVIYSSIDRVAEDMLETQPTIMASVPRFYEKVKSKIESNVQQSGFIKQKLFHWAIQIGRQKFQTDMNSHKRGLKLSLFFGIANKLVLSKIRARTGDRIKYFISGGAPLSSDVAQFFFATGLKILEGYGLTETAPVITVNRPQKPKIGTVGQLLPGNEVKIAEDGEILTRGPNVMKGYYKLPAETAEVMVDEWFHTGDIGSLDEEGFLSITDRKKQLIVTSVGKKVAPQAIEKEVENSPYIEQVLLIGEKRNFISALIVPDFEALEIFAKKNKFRYQNRSDLLRQAAILDLIQKEVDARQSIFSNYEKIRKFQLLTEPFTIENDQLTPTLKIKRRVVEKKYADLIESLYQEKPDNK